MSCRVNSENTNTRNTYRAARSFFNFVSINLSEATPTVMEEAERRPKLLGKWKCNRLPTPNEVLDNTERRRSQSRAQACRSRWEGNGVRNSVFPPLDASCARGNGVRNSPTPGGTASETPKSPKNPQGGTASEITGNGSVLGCSPHEVLDNTERRRSQSQAQACRSKFGFTASRRLLRQGERRPKFANPRGNGVRNS